MSRPPESTRGTVETLTEVVEDGSTPRWRPGETIDGRYLVGDVVGEGGMGVVYEAKQLPLGTRVAVKVLIHLGDEGATARFAREARAASAIGHPHIVSVRDMGTLPDGTSYYVMEHLDGRDLAAELDLVRPIPIARSCRIAVRTASALGAAHAAGVVHRDLKPENVFLTSRHTAAGVVDDFVKVIDFGIAKLKDELALPGPTVSGVRPRDTQAGTIVGTPMYMSPEQCAGLSTDGRSDVYSLGIVLYEMLTGVVPFDGEDALDLLLRQQREKPRRLEETGWIGPPALSAAVMRCLEKRPEDRFASMAELEAALTPFVVEPAPSALAFSGGAPRGTAPALAARESQATLSAERPSALTPASRADVAPAVPRRGRARLVAAVVLGLTLALVAVGLSLRLGGPGGASPAAAPAAIAPSAPLPLPAPAPVTVERAPPTSPRPAETAALPPEPAAPPPAPVAGPPEPASSVPARSARSRRPVPGPRPEPAAAAVAPEGEEPAPAGEAPVVRHRPLEMVADPWGEPEPE